MVHNIQRLQHHHHQGMMDTLHLKGIVDILHHKGMADMVSSSTDLMGIRDTSMMGTLHLHLHLPLPLSLTHLPRFITLDTTIIKRMVVSLFWKDGMISISPMFV